MLRTFFVSACVVVGLCHTSLAEVTLERKFPEDSSYTTETTVRLEQKLTLAGMDVETSNDTKQVAKATVGKRDVEGKLRVWEKIESLQTSTTVMGQVYQFDSANPDAAGSSPLEMLRPMHKELMKRAFTIVYDKANKAVAAEVEGNIAASLPPEVQALVKGQFEPNTMKNAANDDWDQLKYDPINKGDTWKRTRTQNLGAGQLMTFETEYTYEGPIEKDGKTLEKITSKALSVNFTLEDSPLPLALKSSDLKATESEGVILFDNKSHQVVESNSSVRVTGDIVFTVNDNELPAKLDLKIKSTAALKP